MTDLLFTRAPVEGPITTRFGEMLTIDGVTYAHRGVDYGVPVSTPVFAPAGGRIVSFTNDGSFGTGICIDHPDTPWYSLYAHLSGTRAVIGDNIVSGMILGFSGATGKVTGPHLHWQVCKSKDFPTDIAQSADPLSFMAAPAAVVPALTLPDLIQFLGGDSAIRTWNARGNSLVIGYGNMQTALQTLLDRVATLAAAGPMTHQLRADLVRELRELATSLEANK